MTPGATQTPSRREMAKIGDLSVFRDHGVRWAVVAAFALVGLYLTLDPWIDLTVSALFYDPGRGFAADHSRLLSSARHIGSVLGKSLGAAIGVLLIYRLLSRRDAFGVPLRILVFLLAVQLVGPVILVNGIFKEHWGRARPVQITEFNGTKRYTPPLVIADQCPHNCSFVSGESAYGYAYLALGFIPRQRRWRGALFGAGAGFGTIIGAMRIAQGGHFFSDIFFSAVLMFAVAWALYWLIVDPRGGAWLCEATRFVRGKRADRRGEDS